MTEATKKVEGVHPKLSNYLLLFKTYYGSLFAWNVKSSLPAEDIPRAIEAAGREWLLSSAGREYVNQEERHEWGVDFANVLMNGPYEVFARHGIFLGIEIDEIVNLDPDEDLLPEELREE